MIEPAQIMPYAAPAGPTYESAADPFGHDAFLRLLITQIQTQDPFEPLQGSDYLAQLAQFSTVEQLQSANLQLGVLWQAQAVSQALLLIGRHVATADGAVSGLVEAVIFADGEPKLLVGDQQVSPGDVVRVW